MVDDSYQVNIQNGAPGLGAPTQDVLTLKCIYIYIMLIGFHTSFLCALSNARTSITDFCMTTPASTSGVACTNATCSGLSLQFLSSDPHSLCMT